MKDRGDQVDWIKSRARSALDVDGMTLADLKAQIIADFGKNPDTADDPQAAAIAALKGAGLTRAKVRAFLDDLT